MQKTTEQNRSRSQLRPNDNTRLPPLPTVPTYGEREIEKEKGEEKGKKKMRLMNLLVLDPSASKSACRVQEGYSANRKEVVECRNGRLLRW